MAIIFFGRTVAQFSCQAWRKQLQITEVNMAGGVLPSHGYKGENS
jgi:hypothetical protein